MLNNLLIAILGGVAGTVMTILLQIGLRLWDYMRKINCVERTILKELEK